jgi:hypothetical protein
LRSLTVDYCEPLASNDIMYPSLACPLARSIPYSSLIFRTKLAHTFDEQELTVIDLTNAACHRCEDVRKFEEYVRQSCCFSLDMEMTGKCICICISFKVMPE